MLVDYVDDSISDFVEPISTLIVDDCWRKSARPRPRAVCLLLKPPLHPRLSPDSVREPLHAEWEHTHRSHPWTVNLS